MSDTGTIEATLPAIQPEMLGEAPIPNQFAPEEVSRANAAVSGWSQFTDCLGVCRFCVRNTSMALECIEAVIGREMNLKDAMTIGKRGINLLRAYDIRYGLKRELERPSVRYGSVPMDGPVKGKEIMPVWDEMVESYYSRMGWDPKTGKPLPETLRSLGLDYLIQDLETQP